MTKTKGFSLIELMIVVAIIGIISSVAYPSYVRYVERSQVADGISGLTQAAQSMERCYTATFTYQNCTVTAQSPEGFYGIAVTDSGDSTYLLTGTGQSGRVTAGDCSTLTINHRGQKTPASACW